MMTPTASEKFQFILGRRSIRVYAPGEVGEAAIAHLLQAAMAAPSAVARDPVSVSGNTRLGSFNGVSSYSNGKTGRWSSTDPVHSVTITYTDRVNGSTVTRPDPNGDGVIKVTDSNALGNPRLFYRVDETSGP